MKTVREGRSPGGAETDSMRRDSIHGARVERLSCADSRVTRRQPVSSSRRPRSTLPSWGLSAEATLRAAGGSLVGAGRGWARYGSQRTIGLEAGGWARGRCDRAPSTRRHFPGGNRRPWGSALITTGMK